MSNIDARRSHRLPSQEVRRRAEALARGLEQGLGLAWCWDADVIRFHAPGGVARGTRGVLEVGPAEVRLRVELPGLLRLLRGVIASKVEQQLTAQLDAD